MPDTFTLGDFATVAALLIAGWQLHLQRRALTRNSRLNALIHISALLKSKVDHEERIIADLKHEKRDWGTRARHLNTLVIPSYRAADAALFSLLREQATDLDLAKIEQALGPHQRAG